MKPLTFPIARILLAFVAVAAGLSCWAASGVAEDLATRHERLATFQESESSPPGLWRAFVERLVESGLGRASVVAASVSDGSAPAAATRQSAEYWAARYDTFTSKDAEKAGTPAVSVMTANAFFRRAQQEADGRPPSVERLDQATQAYASVLKNGGFNRDAAYNYEFVARLRDSVARSKNTTSPQTRRSEALPGDDLPAGPTIHGRPGAHPPNTRGEDFDVHTPMDYGDREAQPEATPGRPLPRKG